MAIQAMAGAAAAGEVSHILFTPFNSRMQAELQPIVYAIGKQAWSEKPEMIPDNHAIFDCVNRGLLNPTTAAAWLRHCGIIWHEHANLAQFQFPNADDNRIITRAKVWDTVRDSMLSRPTVSLAFHLWQCGHINDDELKAMLKKAGADVDAWFAIRHAYRNTLGLADLQVARNRQFVDQAQYNQELHRMGFHRPRERTLIDQLREALPPISDIIMFAVRDVWDAQAVADNGLFDDLPPQLAQSAGEHGLHGDSGAPLPNSNPPRNATWGETYWAAHWQAISASQAFEMHHRIRQSRLPRLIAAGLDVKEFDLARLRRALGIADYAPGVRDYLTAIAYTPMRLIDIRKALTNNVRVQSDEAFKNTINPRLLQVFQETGRAWAVEQFLDRGYHPDDADIAADLALAQATETIDKPVANYIRSTSEKTIKAIENAYRTGTITTEDAKAKLNAIGIPFADVDKAIANVDLELNTKLVQAAITSIRHDYYAGILTWQNVIDALQQNGVTAGNAQFYADKWRLNWNRTRKTATTQQLLTWLEQGLISLAEANQRLANIGWTASDILTLLRQASIEVTKMQAKATQAQNMAARAQAKQLEAVNRQAEALKRRNIADLRQAMPRTSIQSWLRKGIITPAYAEARLLAQAWPKETVALWISEALAPPVKKNATATTQTAKAPPETGQSANP